MGKSRKTTSKEVTPWIPDAETFQTFQDRAASTITPEFQQALSQAGQTLQGVTGQPAYAPGVAQTLRGQMQAGTQSDPYFNATTRQGPTLDQGFVDTTARAQDPYLRSAAFDQVKQNTIADIMPAINSTFAGSGMTGSSLHQQNLARGLSQGLGAVENQAFQQGEDRALSAANAAQGARSAAFGQALQGAGMRQDAFQADQGRELQAANLMNTAYGQNVGRQIGLAQAQQGLGTAYQGAASGALNNLMSTAVGGGSSQSTQSQRPGLMGILGAGLQIASSFSDERLKTDKKRVGEMDDGTPIYTYKYNEGVAPEFEGKTLMGVMAQDVKKKKAVQTGPDGLMRVNYGAL